MSGADLIFAAFVIVLGVCFSASGFFALSAWLNRKIGSLSQSPRKKCWIRGQYPLIWFLMNLLFFAGFCLTLREFWNASPDDAVTVVKSFAVFAVHALIFLAVFGGAMFSTVFIVKNGLNYFYDRAPDVILKWVSGGTQNFEVNSDLVEIAWAELLTETPTESRERLIVWFRGENHGGR